MLSQEIPHIVCIVSIVCIVCIVYIVYIVCIHCLHCLHCLYCKSVAGVYFTHILRGDIEELHGGQVAIQW